MSDGWTDEFWGDTSRPGGFDDILEQATIRHLAALAARADRAERERERFDARFYSRHRRQSDASTSDNLVTAAIILAGT